MEKNQIWLMIVIALVVAVITSIVTVSLSGRVINVNPAASPQPVYTKAEIDTKLSSLTTNQDVLDMLSRCWMYSLDGVCQYSNKTTICSNSSIFGSIPLDTNKQVAADTLCNKIYKTCDVAMMRYGSNRELTELAGCNQKIDPVTLRFLCCSP